MTRATRSWRLAVGAVVVALIVVGVPVWLIQPFAPQTPEAVEWSWRLRQVAPHVTVAMTLLLLAAAVALWPMSAAVRWHQTLRRTTLVALLAVAVGAIWFARQNHFEWMFRPCPDARFAAAAEATDVPASAPVLGIASTKAALAFPHHPSRLPPPGECDARRCADRRHVLNALSHRSGVGAGT